MNLKRVTLTYEILMAVDDDLGQCGLSEIAEQCGSGDWSGRSLGVTKEILIGEKACQDACDDHATGLDFFFPKEDEEDS